MVLRGRDLAGIAGLRAAGALLLEQRSEDLSGGMWDAADLEWWWAAGEGAGFRTRLWTDSDGQDVAYLILPQARGGLAPGDRVDAGCGRLPSADPAVRTEVLPSVVARLAALPATAQAPVVVVADERDGTSARGW